MTARNNFGEALSFRAQCAGFCAETGAASGRPGPPQSGIFNDLAIWRGRHRWQISIRNARVVGSIPISGNQIKHLRFNISSISSVLVFG
jgi:hypothetical protein